VLSRPLRAGEKIAIGGLAEKTLKKLNGERLGVPFSSMVLTQAMGLGATLPKSNWCNFPTGISPGIKVAILFF